MRPANRIAPLDVSRIRNKNGWSARNVTGCAKAVSATATPVAAAASVPSSDTSMNAREVGGARERSRHSHRAQGVFQRELGLHSKFWQCDRHLLSLQLPDPGAKAVLPHRRLNRGEC